MLLFTVKSSFPTFGYPKSVLSDVSLSEGKNSIETPLAYVEKQRNSTTVPVLA